MENKYYTPELSEFHIGFEYEYLASHPKEFFPTKLESFSEYIWDDELTLGNEISQGNIRVKYLDREDIESLIQFELEILEFIEDNVFEFNFNKAGIDYRVFYTYSDHMISFYEVNPSSDILECFFRGTIKNKSELKKLISQLGI